MLKKIPKIISPELLKILAEMGHADEIVIADGNFPGAAIAQRLVRADGHGVPELLTAILELFPLDRYNAEQAYLMEVVAGDDYQPVIWRQYEEILARCADEEVTIGQIERFAFYERAKRAYAVIQTGEAALYANIILKKGVV